MTWPIIAALAFLAACSEEKVKEIELVPVGPIETRTVPVEPPRECPVCPACPVPPTQPVPGPTPTPYPGENDTVRAINAARKLKGLAPVYEDSRLDCAAQAHARDIAVTDACGHVGSDGSQFWQRAQRCGTQALGEIVACGYPNAVTAVAGWDRSPSHAAIMYGAYARVGVAEVRGYWVAVFSD